MTTPPRPGWRRHLSRFSRMLGLSAVSAAITMVLPILLHYGAGVDEHTAVASCLVLAFVVNFIGFRMVVFQSTGHYGGQLLRFATASLISRSLEYLATSGLLSLGLPFAAAVLATQSVFTVLKYVLYGRLVFQQPRVGPPP